jgi:nitroreductase
MNPVIQQLKSHVSVRNFTDQPIDDQLLREIIEAGQHASTSNHIQAYTIIRVNDKGKRRALAKLAGNQPYVEECPVFLVFCADLNRLGKACIMNNKKFESGYTENFILATVDTSLAAQNIMIAAESAGLGGVYIGALRNNPEDVCYLLNIPHNVYPVFGMCLGYPQRLNNIKPRLPLSLVFKEDSYTTEGDEEELREYDSSIRDYYIERTNGARTNTWTEGMSTFLKDKQRPHMREFLRNKGFEMK